MRPASASERNLVNILVQSVLTTTADPVFCAKTNDEKAAWVAKTLEDNGYSNQPVGSNYCYVTGVNDTGYTNANNR